MKKYGMLIGLTLTVIVSILCACQPVPEKDIVVDKGQEQVNEAKKMTESDTNGRLDTEEKLKISDSFCGADTNVNIKVNGTVSMNQIPNCIVHVRPHTITSEEVKILSEFLFQGNEVYDQRVEKSKSEIQEEILDIRSYLSQEDKIWENASTQEDYDAICEYWEKYLKRLEADYETAPDKVTSRKSTFQFHPQSYYMDDMGYDEMNEKDIAFNKTETLEVTGKVASGHGHLSVSNRNENDYHYHGLYFYTTDVTSVGELQDSQEEAEKIAGDIAKYVGHGEWGIRYCEKVESEIGSFYRISMTPDYRGYKVLPLPQLLTVKGEGEYSAGYYYEELSMCISNGNVVEMAWESPMDVIETVEDKRPESWNTIYNQFVNQMKVEYTLSKTVHDTEVQDYRAAEISIRDMECGFARIKKKNSDYEFWYVPAVGFYGDSGWDTGDGIQYYSDENHNPYSQIFVMINALDHSVIHTNLGY